MHAPTFRAQERSSYGPTGACRNRRYLSCAKTVCADRRRRLVEIGPDIFQNVAARFQRIGVAPIASVEWRDFVVHYPGDRSEIDSHAIARTAQTCRTEW
ncbi:hypothetical protein D9M69_734040 [compost metagenome]